MIAALVCFWVGIIVFVGSCAFALSGRISEHERNERVVDDERIVQLRRRAQ